MINSAEIKPNMPVVCSKDGQFAVVDHMEGQDTLKLNKDKAGQHHYIPLAWVKSVDAKVHIDRPGDQAMREWSMTPPTHAAPVAHAIAPAAHAAAPAMHAAAPATHAAPVAHEVAPAAKPAAAPAKPAAPPMKH